MQVTVDSSLVSVDLNSVQDMLNFVVKYVLLPKANKLTAAGIPLPTVDGVSFQDPSVAIMDGYALVATDISVTL